VLEVIVVVYIQHALSAAGMSRTALLVCWALALAAVVAALGLVAAAPVEVLGVAMLVVISAVISLESERRQRDRFDTFNLLQHETAQVSPPRQVKACEGWQIFRCRRLVSSPRPSSASSLPLPCFPFACVRVVASLARSKC